MGISDQTFYRWKKKFVGTGVAEVRRLRILAEENRKLMQLVADLSSNKQIFQEVFLQKALKPAQKRSHGYVLERSAIGLVSGGYAGYYSV